MSLKQRVKILLYDFVKVCPPARRLVRHMLFKYREVTFRRHTKGISTDPNLMVFCTSVAGGAVPQHDGAQVGQRALSEGHGGGKILGV